MPPGIITSSNTISGFSHSAALRPGRAVLGLVHFHFLELQRHADELANVHLVFNDKHLLH